MTAPAQDRILDAGASTAAADARQVPVATAPPGSRTFNVIGNWRRWRVPMFVVAFVLLGAVLIALIKPAPKITGYLDPAGTDRVGTHAIADILGARGYSLVSTYGPSAALHAADLGGATLVITNPELLTSAALTSLAAVRANIVLVEPTRAALRILTPGVTIAGLPPVSGRVGPACALRAAQLAGNADVGGISFDISKAPAGVIGCYPFGGKPSLVRYVADGKVVTILGSGRPLANGYLASRGNAALALNLLSVGRRVVWLTSRLAPVGTGPPGPAKSLFDLIPLGAYLVALQLGIAAVLAALWRGRRLGQLVPERLPVVVRAAETVEGHARLYQARRARDRAAASMREAMLARVVPALGLPRDAPPDAVTAALDQRSAAGRAAIAETIFGPPPASDADLVRLVRDLDELEREVRAQ
jgi:hypothetical protein